MFMFVDYLSLLTMTKFILVSGGVVSGIGKGVIGAFRWGEIEMC